MRKLLIRLLKAVSVELLLLAVSLQAAENRREAQNSLKAPS